MQKIYGLVVCGGQSSRMGTDKSLLVYHGQPQRYYLYDMIGKICEKVFISCNAYQATNIPGKYNIIIDDPRYSNIGPMAALLTAFDQYPGADFLVVGCDYPFVRKEDLFKLIDKSKSNAHAASYYNQSETMREPLLAFYKSSCHEILQSNFENEAYSLRHFLNDINALTVLPSSPQMITSVDTREQYEAAIRLLAQ